jgi:hypothetical protein
MPLSLPTLRRFARQALVGATGRTAPDKTQLASAFDRLCETLRSRLHPLFGPTASAALFARAHHLAAAEFPWLTTVIPKTGERCSLEALDRVGTAIDSDALEEGLAAVLAHDIGLLIVFIGEDFVMPLVQAAWETPSGRAARIEGDHE